MIEPCSILRVLSQSKMIACIVQAGTNILVFSCDLVRQRKRADLLQPRCRAGTNGTQRPSQIGTRYVRKRRPIFIGQARYLELITRDQFQTEMDIWLVLSENRHDLLEIKEALSQRYVA